MKTREHLLLLLLALSLLCASSNAQSAAVVPRLVNFSGKATDAQGKAISGIAGTTFAIYKDPDGGAPLWMETQNVAADKTGHYTAQLGATKPNGLPLELFSSNEARWLGVTLNGGQEQPRVLLLSVPYALKAADSETLGGKPLSAFQLATPQSSSRGPLKTSPLAEQANEIVCTSGTGCKTGFVPLFSSNGGSAKVTDSLITQSGTTVKITGSETVTGNIGASNLTASGSVNAGQIFAGPISAGQISASVSSGSAVSATGPNGVFGSSTSSSGNGVYGSNLNHTGVYGDGTYGVWGHSSSSIGVYGDGTYGVWGHSSSGIGVAAFGNIGVQATGSTSGSGYGVIAVGGAAGVAAGSETGQALVATTGPNTTADTVVIINKGGGFPFFAGGTVGGVYIDAAGDLVATGSINGSAKNFRIDHPLDPANKYLYHASVESSEMMNLYTGNVTTDAQGNAVVHLPDWFETLNRDFRYQLTSVGQFSQAIISREIANRQFSIQTDKPNVKVSWQVTGIRQDAWANAHPISVEQLKLESERGLYLHPELFGASAEKGIAQARHPEMQKISKERGIQPQGSTNH